MDIPPVWTDPVAAVAVMDNLLSNAVKYSFPGKQIWAKRFRLIYEKFNADVASEVGPIII